MVYIHQKNGACTFTVTVICLGWQFVLWHCLLFFFFFASRIMSGKYGRVTKCSGKICTLESCSERLWKMSFRRNQRLCQVPGNQWNTHLKKKYVWEILTAYIPTPKECDKKKNALFLKKLQKKIFFFAKNPPFHTISQNLKKLPYFTKFFTLWKWLLPTLFPPIGSAN